MALDADDPKSGMVADDQHLEFVVEDDLPEIVAGDKDEHEPEDDDSEEELDSEGKRLKKRAQYATRDKKRYRDQRDEARREAEELRKQIEDLQRGQQAIAARELDRDVSTLEEDFKRAREERKKAFASGDPDEFEQSEERLRKAERRLQEAESRKKQVAEPRQPTLSRQAQNWIRENEWFESDPEGVDAQLAHVISKDLLRRGYRADSEEHFDELNTELRRRAPHLFKKEEDKERPRTRTTGGGGMAQSSGPAKKVTIPRDTIQAWRAAGLDWDTMSAEEQKSMARDWYAQEQRRMR